MTTAMLIVLGLAVGFGAAVWAIIAVSIWHRNRWRSIANWCIALADLICAVIIGYRLVTLPHLPVAQSPRTTVLLLVPIIVIPPALRIRDWFMARNLTTKAAGHE